MRDFIPSVGTRVGTLVSTAIVVAALYFAKPLLLPFALAALFVFILAPLVLRLERLRLGRVPAVLVAVTFATAIVVAIGWVVVGQVMDLAESLPRYESSLRSRILAIRGPGGGPLEKASATVNRLVDEATLSPPEPQPLSGQPPPLPGVAPLPVSIVEARPTPSALVRGLLGSLCSALGTAGVVLFLTIFFLLYREDFRDRWIGLLSRGRIGVTTQAMGEASRRISRYLLSNLSVNAIYGTAVGVGLHALGMPNSALWGLLAGVLRFLPYIGVWIAAAFPVAVSVAVFDGWGRVGAVAALFLALDLLIGNVLEPWLYGKRTGLAPLAVVVCAVFWGWLWGAVGLLLAVPLTLCLAVAGRHVPSLAFLNVLLGAQPGLGHADRFLQRLVAQDEEEAASVAEDYLKTRSLEELYDGVILPALQDAKHDRAAGVLDEAAAARLRGSVGELVEELGSRVAVESARGGSPAIAAADAPPALSARSTLRARILYLPLGDESDVIAGEMLAQLLSRDGIRVDPLSAGALSGESLAEVERRGASVVCIGGLPPLAVMRARYLCKRLRSRLTSLRIVVGIWDAGRDPVAQEARMHGSGADQVVVRLAAACECLRQAVAERAAVDAGPLHAERKSSGRALRRPAATP